MFPLSGNGYTISTGTGEAWPGHGRVEIAMLSHDEDRHLRAIEQWLETDDPALARMFRTHEPPVPDQLHQRRAARIAVDLAGGLTFVMGALLGAGVLVVLGTLLISVGVCLHLAARKPQN